MNGTRVFGDGKTQADVFYQYNWPYDFFSTVEMAKLEAKVDFYSELEVPVPQLSTWDAAPGEINSIAAAASRIENNTQLATEHLVAQEYQLATFPYSASQQSNSSDEVQQYSVVGGNSSSTVTSTLVVRQELKPDTAAASQTYTISVPSGFSLQPGSEQIFVNGLLMTPGSSNDYTISGNNITFIDTILGTDSIYVTYLKDSNS